MYKEHGSEVGTFENGIVHSTVAVVRGRITRSRYSPIVVTLGNLGIQKRTTENN